MQEWRQVPEFYSLSGNQYESLAAKEMFHKVGSFGADLHRSFSASVF